MHGFMDSTVQCSSNKNIRIICVSPTRIYTYACIQYMRLCLISMYEQDATETLINNYLDRERAFYRLNERFVSNITGDTCIIFSTRSSAVKS